jgi:hypothetical protein
MLGRSWLATQLAASQEGLSSVNKWCHVDFWMMNRRRYGTGRSSRNWRQNYHLGIRLERLRATTKKNKIRKVGILAEIRAEKQPITNLKHCRAWAFSIHEWNRTSDIVHLLCTKSHKASVIFSKQIYLFKYFAILVDNCGIKTLSQKRKCPLMIWLPFLSKCFN